MAQTQIAGVTYEKIILSDTSGNPVSPGGAGPQREVSNILWTASAAGTGYSIGDKISQKTIIDVSTSTPTTDGVLWRNETTQLDLATAPNIADLTLVGSTGLTDGELRASPLALPTGAATSALQTSGNGSLTSIDGKVVTTLNGIKVDGSAATQPVSATALPLPTGAATSAAQTTGNASLSAIDGKLPAQVSGRVPVDGSGVTQPVSGLFLTDTQLRATAVPVSTASLPLPTGAATESKQDTGNTSLSSIDTKTPVLVTGRVPVDGSAVTQPVSAASLPLPTGAATDALQTAGNAQLQKLNDTFQPVIFDAAGRVRTSEAHSLFDGKTLGADLPEVWSNAGTGSGLFANNAFNMSVTAGQYYVRQSKQYMPYFAGKSQVIEWTFDNFQNEVGVEKGAGYISSSGTAPFDTAYDGFAVVSTGTTYELRIYNAGSLTTVDWTAWDAYAEISAYDFSKFTIFSADFLWLGGSEIRLFMKLPTGWKLVHTYEHAGNFAGTIMRTPNQPVRYWIRSSTGAGSFRAICSSVSTEGTTDEHGSTVGLFNQTAITANTVGTTYALLGVRKTAANRDLTVKVQRFGVVQTAAGDGGILLLLRNPTLSAALTYSAAGRIETALATNQTVTATGDVVACLSSFNAGSFSALDSNYGLFLGSTVGDAMDQYVLAYRSITANQTVYGDLTYKTY